MAGRSMAAALQQQGVRLTRQRRILLDVVDRSGRHLDAEQLYQLARQQYPKLNRVTVYRTLKLLKEIGLVDELDLMHYDGVQHYYETRLKQEHAHVVCLGCGRVDEYYGEPLQKIRQQVEETLGYRVVQSRTEVGGYCPHCQMLGVAEEKAAPQSKARPAKLRHPAALQGQREQK